MRDYIGVNLRDMLEQIGEIGTKKIISDFSCPLNRDIEGFLKNSAVDFSKQGISSTYLVFLLDSDVCALVGYFTLANKFFSVMEESISSNTLKRRIAKFAQYDAVSKRYTLSAPLIGQLSKNYSHGYDALISGDELLKLALDKIKEFQMIVGGKFVYLECEDCDYLLDFYSDNGFVIFGKREVEQTKTDTEDVDYLIQMLKYMN